MASYYVVVPCLCFGAWENVGMAGFLGTLTLPARCVRTRAIHSHAQCCVSKDPGVSLFGLALHFIFISKCGRSVSVLQPLVYFTDLKVDVKLIFKLVCLGDPTWGHLKIF